MPEMITLRPAHPTLGQGVLFARYLDTATDGLLRFMLGAGFERVISNAYVEPAHDLSYEHVTFAVRGDAVVGMVSAYSSEQHSRSSNLPLIRGAGWRIVRAGAAAVLTGRLLRFLDDIPEGDFYLQAVAVAPDSRVGGVGTVLFEHAQGLAMAAAEDRLTLHVAVENTAACRLYERLGMHIDATSPKASPLPGLQVHRMVKPL